MDIGIRTNEEFLHDNTLKNETFDLSHVDIVCFSHLRWDFVYQRPQHILSRFAQYNQLFFIEEPVYDAVGQEVLQVNSKGDNIWIIVPHLLKGLNEEEISRSQKLLLDKFFFEYKLEEYIFWYYTPMALPFSEHFNPLLVIYDCMDELSAFKFAPPDFEEFENKLFEESDIVFTGGHSLYEAKKDKHTNIYAFPSSIDKNHFSHARNILEEPEDQKSIPHPRLGFFGVIDERFDIGLINKIAKERPEWHLVMIGPIIKIGEESLHGQDNIHFLGNKSYNELPRYLAGWDIALIPFLMNESTKFISPTKTPEYLAAGKPVISTPINDIVKSYGKNGLVHIAETAEDFIKAAEMELSQMKDKELWLSSVDDFLLDNSWDNTWTQMSSLIKNAYQSKFSI